MIDSIGSLFAKINRPLNFMEVCGTHTVAIFKHGIRSLLPAGLKLLSGPGCPVCVTSIKDVDRAVAFAMRDNVILATFGDMMRIPGGGKSLAEAKAEGAHIRIVYSPLDCLTIARENQDKKIVFFAAGFETTAPSIAATVYEAERHGVDNFYVYSVNKVVPPALELLLNSDEMKIDGFILPGHVSTIIGSGPYVFIPTNYSVPCVIAGFGAEDILSCIVMLLRQIREGRADIEIQYTSAVRESGNKKAIDFMNDYFEQQDSYWRGIGVIRGSGLKLRKKWSHRDAEVMIPVDVPDIPEPKGCLCGLVLRGVKMPPQCPLFGKVCTPEKPVGACMVSTEGSCAAYYKYKDVLI